MGSKILEIEEGQKMIYSLDNVIIFTSDNKKVMIPINDLFIVIINNIAAICSLKLLNELTRRNIMIVLCDEKHLPQTYCIPISGHYNSLKKLESQISWTNSFKQEKWQQIIKQKITAQMLLLKTLSNSIEQFQKMINEVKLGDTSNREAVAANKYFSILYGNNFERRSEKDEFNNYVNSFLNYGYAILLSIVVRSIVKNGYEARIALFHKSFSNHHALGSDLMEPFRPIVDKCVWRILREIKADKIVISQDIKRQLVDLFTKHIIYNNERMQISLAIDKYVYDVLDTKNKINIEYLYELY